LLPPHNADAGQLHGKESFVVMLRTKVVKWETLMIPNIVDTW
jgi:hypothetical protein